MGEERTFDSTDITTPLFLSETFQYLSSIIIPLEIIRNSNIVFIKLVILFDKNSKSLAINTIPRIKNISPDVAKRSNKVNFSIIAR